MCADTDIRYVLNIIKKYEYKPEEYALHNGKLNKAEKKKAKQCQVEKIQKLTLSYMLSIAYWFGFPFFLILHIAINTNPPIDL